MSLKKIASSVLTVGLAVSALPLASQVAFAAEDPQSSDDIVSVEQGEEQSLETPQSSDETPQSSDDIAQSTPVEDAVAEAPAVAALTLPATPTVKVGWVQVGGKWFYFAANGVKKTGWNLISGKWYYLQGDGSMWTGWGYIGGKWYYLLPSGAMATGWIQLGGRWYYLDASGAMRTGWSAIGGKWYYLQADGSMWTGWGYIGGKWYYLLPSGAMATGWIQLGGNWFYLDASGAMVTGTRVIDGKTNSFNSSGIWTGYGPTAQYTVEDLMFQGVIYWNGNKFTYYSQRVLPGGGLAIPGRHVNSGGFVSDGSGYIVLAAAWGIPHGTVYDTPFGYQGKVYDTCGNCSYEWLDVYTR